MLARDAADVSTPVPTVAPAPDWDVLGAQAKASAEAWEQRHTSLTHEYANLFARYPGNDKAPDLGEIRDAKEPHTPQGTFKRWNKLGMKWRASCEDLQRHITTQQP